jgi:hypothetical protein
MADRDDNSPQFRFTADVLHPAPREVGGQKISFPEPRALVEMFYGLQQLNSKLTDIQVSQLPTAERRKKIEETLESFNLLPPLIRPYLRDGMEWFARVGRGESAEDALAAVADRNHADDDDPDAAAHRNITRCFKDHLRREPPVPIPGTWKMVRWRLQPPNKR